MYQCIFCIGLITNLGSRISKWTKQHCSIMLLYNSNISNNPNITCKWVKLLQVLKATEVSAFDALKLSKSSWRAAPMGYPGGMDEASMMHMQRQQQQQMLEYMVRVIISFTTLCSTTPQQQAAQQGMMAGQNPTSMMMMQQLPMMVCFQFGW